MSFMVISNATVSALTSSPAVMLTVLIVPLTGATSSVEVVSVFSLSISFCLRSISLFLICSSSAAASSSMAPFALARRIAVSQSSIARVSSSFYFSHSSGVLVTFSSASCSSFSDSACCSAISFFCFSRSFFVSS